MQVLTAPDHLAKLRVYLILHAVVFTGSARSTVLWFYFMPIQANGFDITHKVRVRADG